MCVLVCTWMVVKGGDFYCHDKATSARSRRGSEGIPSAAVFFSPFSPVLGRGHDAAADGGGAGDVFCGTPCSCSVFVDGCCRPHLFFVFCFAFSSLLPPLRPCRPPSLLASVPRSRSFLRARGRYLFRLGIPLSLATKVVVTVLCVSFFVFG